MPQFLWTKWSPPLYVIRLLALTLQVNFSASSWQLYKEKSEQYSLCNLQTLNSLVISHLTSLHSCSSIPHHGNISFGRPAVLFPGLSLSMDDSVHHTWETQCLKIGKWWEAVVWANYVSDCPQSNQGLPLGCTYLSTLQIKWELPGGIHNSKFSSFRFLKKLETELPYNPAIPLLGIHTEETRIQRDTCTPVFITALFIITRTWKQPRCWQMDKKAVVHIHNGILLSH